MRMKEAMKRIVFIGLLVGIALAVIASEPVKVIMATTDDGRRVILMPDGKWNFVEGAPQAAKPEIKSESGDCRSKLWPDLLNYFSAWDLSQSQKDSFLLKTDWNRIEVAAMFGIPVTYRVKVSVLLKDNCSMKLDTYYQVEQESGWADVTIEKLRKTANFVAAPGTKKVVEFDDKLRVDLEAMVAKAKSP